MNPRRYRGEHLDVSYDIRRCIHVGECVRGLPAVFDKLKRPWIQPDNSEANRVAALIHRCPTGALKYVRHDSGSEEPIPKENTITLMPGGPLFAAGRIQIMNGGGEVILEDTRLALCRCGASANKPFCDNTHRQIPYHDLVEDQIVLSSAKQMADDQLAPSAPLRIQPSENGPYLLAGPFTIMTPFAESRFQGTQAELCRCGSSQTKPFCDNSHKRVGFTAASW